jgi:hypothetical protein
MVTRIHTGEHSPWVCPRCSARLSLIDSPGLFDLSCPEGCFNYNFHRDPETKEFMHGHFFSRPPRRRGESSEPCAAPNGGPAASVDNTNAPGGPPSVS